MSHLHIEATWRRYLSLGLGELASAAVFASVSATSVAAWFTGSDGARALWSALLPLLVILVQAGAYWLAARCWVGHGRMPPRLATAYRVFRVVDPALLIAGLAGILLWRPGHAGLLTLALGVWMFGVIEYVNYFVVRLAYPATQCVRRVREWRTPTLIKDIRESETLTG